MLTEENLRALYGVVLKRIAFEHGGKTVRTLVPVIFPVRGESDNADGEMGALGSYDCL